jgi:hypothetical protein
MGAVARGVSVGLSFLSVAESEEGRMNNNAANKPLAIGGNCFMSALPIRKIPCVIAL